MPPTRPARMTLHVISTTTTLNVGVAMDFLAAIVEIVSHEVNLCQRLDYNPCVHLLHFFIIVDIVLISKSVIMFNKIRFKKYFITESNMVLTNTVENGVSLS